MNPDLSILDALTGLLPDEDRVMARISDVLGVVDTDRLPTMADLCSYSVNDLSTFPGLNIKSAKQIEQILVSRGYGLRDGNQSRVVDSNTSLSRAYPWATAGKSANKQTQMFEDARIISEIVGGIAERLSKEQSKVTVGDLLKLNKHDVRMILRENWSRQDQAEQAELKLVEIMSRNGWLLADRSQTTSDGNSYKGRLMEQAATHLSSAVTQANNAIGDILPPDLGVLLDNLVKDTEYFASRLREHALSQAGSLENEQGNSPTL